MMDVERDVVRMHDYLADRLSAEDHAAFEERLSKDPSLVKELDLTLQLKEGFQQLKGSGAVETGSRAAAARDRYWFAGLAAAVIAGAAFFLWLASDRSAASVLISGAEAQRALSPTSVVAGLTLSTPRARNAPPVVLTPAKGWVELRVLPPARLARSPISIRLFRRNPDGTMTWAGASEAGRLEADGFLTCYANAALLHSGFYTLELRARERPNSDQMLFEFIAKVGRTVE